jgi:hypothetical protein
LELYSFQDVFNSLADRQGSISYLKEETLTRYLEIPDVLGVSSILFQVASYLGAFPFSKDAPAVLGFEQMVLVVSIMTDRYKKVLKNSRDRTRLLFRSLAVFDRGEGGYKTTDVTKDKFKDNAVSSESNTGGNETQGHPPGFAVDTAANDEEGDEDDGLALAALEALDSIEAFKHSDAPITQASIPSDNMRRLIMLLLLIAPLHAQDSLTKYSDRLVGEKLVGLRRTADSILAAFTNVEKYPGVKIHQFNNVIPISLPFMFNGFNPLFENFLFSKNLDFTKRKDSTPDKSAMPGKKDQVPLSQGGEILDINILSQLSFFLPGSSLFGNLRLLYSGGDAGFSMGSFEAKVFNWRAPTLLLVSGDRITDPPTSSQEKSFADTLPPKRFPDSSRSSHVVFGVYLSQPWKQTYKDCFGSADTLLFQLEPTHEVFKPSSVNNDYVSFTKYPTSYAGIGIGCPHPKAKATAGHTQHVLLGAVSLILDSSFEFGVFTHNYNSGGGAFHTSSSRRYDFQDRFEIESLEVWGCGGNVEAEQQKQRWAWEEREAEARRKINLGTGDIEADRRLLEMAGIINSNRSGGSIR